MKLKAIIKHFMTITRHKLIVCRECIACGQIWRGLMHDNSKYSLAEFVPSAMHFQGTRSPIEAEKEETGYSAAWLHHKGHNKHHWEYWTDFDDAGGIIANKIPYEYVVEMVCDWIGAGMVYSKEKWTPAATLDYYDKVRASRRFHPVTEGLIIGFLVTLRHEGLKGFHREAKSNELQSFYRATGSKTIVPAERSKT